MKKFIILFILAVLSACAAPSKELTSLELVAERQKVRSNEFTLQRERIHGERLDDAHRRDQLRKLGLTETEIRAIMEREMEERELRGEAAAPVILPSNIGITMEEAANMDYDDLCKKVVAQAIAAKGVASVLEARDPDEYNYRYDEVSGNCVMYNTIKEMRRFRLWDYIYPYGRYGYSAPNPYGIGVGIGVVVKRDGRRYYGAPGDRRQKLYRKLGYDSSGQAYP